jgi:phospholipase/carboxylesterase
MTLWRSCILCQDTYLAGLRLIDLFHLNLMKKKTIYTARFRDLVMKIQIPDGGGPHPIMFLLHGWTGDEDSMWIFAPRLPDHYLMISPRGLYKSPLGGYAWHEHRSSHWPAVDEFHTAVETLLDLLQADQGLQGAFADALMDANAAEDILTRSDFSKVSLVGFSQGAALSYSFTLLYPELVHLLGGLAGFMPERVDELVDKKPLVGKKVFITHGTQDQIVPVDKARRSVDLLKRAGSDVTYCEQQVGHKLSASCFRALESFFISHS